MEGTGATAIDSAFHFSYAYNRKDYSDWENRRITPPFPPISLPALKDDQTKLKSADLNPDVGNLNNVAYELADDNQKLPEALEYAKKAD